MSTDKRTDGAGHGAMAMGHGFPRVCFLLEDFYPIVHGASVQTIMLARRFIADGGIVTVVTRRLFSEHAAREEHEGIRVFRVPPAVGVHRLGKYLMLFPALWRLLRVRTQFDVLVVSDLKVLGICGVVAARILGKVCLLNAVSLGEMDGSYATVYETRSSPMKMLAVRTFIRVRDLIVKRADHFISISSALTEEFLRCGIEASKISQIHYGVDTSVFRPVSRAEKAEVRERHGLPDGRCFVYTGRLITGKGLEHLLSAWHRLAGEFDDVTLLLVGSGQGYALSNEDRLRGFVATHGLESRVHFTGNVADVCSYLQASDVFVFPSQSEGLGLSLLEALSCELPAIATGVGGILDILEHDRNGLLVRYGDESGLYETMKYLLENPERSRQLAQAGRATILERFDVDRCADKYLALFRRLLGVPAADPEDERPTLSDATEAALPN